MHNEININEIRKQIIRHKLTMLHEISDPSALENFDCYIHYSII